MAVVMHLTGIVHMTIHASLPAGHPAPGLPAPRRPRGGADDDHHDDGDDGYRRRSDRIKSRADVFERDRKPSRALSRSRAHRRSRSPSRRVSPSRSTPRGDHPRGTLPKTLQQNPPVLDHRLRVPSTPHVLLSAAPMTPFAAGQIRGSSPPFVEDAVGHILRAPERTVRRPSSVL